MKKFLLDAIFLMFNAFDAVFESLSIDFDWEDRRKISSASHFPTKNNSKLSYFEL